MWHFIIFSVQADTQYGRKSIKKQQHEPTANDDDKTNIEIEISSFISQLISAQLSRLAFIVLREWLKTPQLAVEVFFVLFSIFCDVFFVFHHTMHADCTSCLCYYLFGAIFAEYNNNNIRVVSTWCTVNTENRQSNQMNMQKTVFFAACMFTLALLNTQRERARKKIANVETHKNTNYTKSVLFCCNRYIWSHLLKPLHH